MSFALASSAKISLFVALSRVLGLAREMVFAALFGAGVHADAFLVAFRIPNLLRDLLAEGALSSAFVPAFTQAWLGPDPRAAFLLANRMLAWLTLALATLCAAVVAFPAPVVAALSDSFAGNLAKFSLCVELTRIVMPYLLCVVVAALWMGMLNAQERYTWPAAVPLLFNAVSILTGAALMVVGGTLHEQIAWWAWGTLAAGVVQPLVLLPSLWRQGYRPRLTWRKSMSDPAVRRIARQMIPAVVGSAALQINVVVNTTLASALGDGPVAQLSYAFRVFFLPVGMFGVALATVTTTRVSTATAQADQERLRSTLSESLDAVWALMLASSIGMVGLAQPITAILFERGAFDHQQSLATALVLQAYGLALIPYGLVKVQVPVFYGLDRARVPLIASVMAIAGNIAFNLLTYTRLGAAGLALGTALASVINAFVLRLALYRLIGPLRPAWPLRAWLALLVAGVTLAGFVGLGQWIDEWLINQSVPGKMWLRLAVLMATIGLGGGCYIALLARFDHPSAQGLRRVFQRLSKRLSRRRPPSSST